jgi:hypothetical protein
MTMAALRLMPSVMPLPKVKVMSRLKSLTGYVLEESA